MQKSQNAASLPSRTFADDTQSFIMQQDSDSEYIFWRYFWRRLRQSIGKRDNQLNRKSQMSWFPRISDVVNSGSKFRMSTLPEPIPELVERWQMQDQFADEAKEVDRKRKSTQQEAAKKISKKNSANQRLPREIRQLDKTFLTKASNDLSLNQDSEIFEFREDVKTNLEGETSIFLEPSFKLDRKKSVKIQDRNSEKDQGINDHEIISNNVLQRSFAGQSKRSVPQQQSIFVPPKKPADQKRKTSRRKRKPSRPKSSKKSKSKHPPSRQRPPVNEKNESKQNSNTSSQLSIVEAPRKQQHRQRSAKPSADEKGKATKKEPKPPARKGNRRKTKPKNSRSPSANSVLSKSITRGEHYHKLYDKRPEDEQPPEGYTKSDKEASQQDTQFHSQQPRERRKAKQRTEIPSSVVSKITNCDIPREASHRKIEFVPIEQLELEQAQSSGNRYPIRKRFKPMPYWEGSRLERSKGKVVGVTTRRPEQLKKKRVTSISEMLSSELESIHEAPEAFGIERYFGVKSRHKLTKIPSTVNRYQLQIPPGEIFIVAKASFRSVGLSFVSGDANKLYLDKGEGANKFKAPTIISYPEGFTLNNRSGSKLCVLEAEVELLQHVS